MVCHCLLIESDQGLILVDTGFGTLDVRNPATRFGRLTAALFRIEEDEARTAVRQIKTLGFDPNDVRHIVLTHLDFDHAGGLPDFPLAKVHVLDLEHGAAMAPRSAVEKMRYAAADWAHGVDWQLHSVQNGERWFGFDYVRAISGVAPEVLLVPLFGHTRGHCGVAVSTQTGWLLHCGDAIMHHDELDPADPTPPVGLKILESVMVDSAEARDTSRAMLLELHRSEEPRVKLICSHDPAMLDDAVWSARKAAYLG